MTRLLAALLCALAAARADPQHCGLPKERGTCDQFAVRYYYDTEYGGCLRFWYGGCGGNGNRFSRETDCERACVSPPGDALCRLPAVRGACKRAKPRWYSDPAGRCRPFTYSGCLGNDNRFESEAACQQRCGGVPPGGGATPPTVPGPAACQLPDRLAGECGQYVIQYSFVAARQQCAPFYYGGCGGNGNRFDTAEACQAACVRPPAPRPPYYGPRDRPAYSPQQRTYGRDDQPTYGTEEQPTYDRATEGPYQPYQPHQTQAPYQPYQPYQPHQTQAPYQPYQPETEAPYQPETEAPYQPYQPETEAPAAGPCSLPAEPGPCRAYMPRFYFSAADGRCLSFVFGGCSGNSNNFETRSACEARCAASPYLPEPETTEAETERPAPETEPADVYVPPPTTADPAVDPCMLPRDTGECRAYLRSYYYDAEGQRCVMFGYGGCGGNANRFRTQSECEQRCAPDGVAAAEPTEPAAQLDVCQQAPVAGGCGNRLPRHYFNAALQRCFTFVYSGCGGNGNRFSSAAECAARCLPDAPPPTAPPQLPAEPFQSVPTTTMDYSDYPTFDYGAQEYGLPGAGTDAPVPTDYAYDDYYSDDYNDQ